MTRKEAESLPPGARVVFDNDQLARLWCPDAKWTADMRGMAVIQRINADGSVPSWAPRRGQLLVSRRSLRIAT